jgi:multiple sugar transport system substrate-binding protein
VNGRRRLISIAALVCCASTLAASCGGGSSSGGGGTSESIRGQTITVLVPYKMPQSLLDKFTAETGVKVNYVVTGWDQTHNKLLVANEAGSYIADVAEFDWSFTGQFAGAGWVEPLNGLVDQKTLGDLQSTDKAFTSGGKTYAACYSNDFRMSMYNKKMFQKAGITSFPATFDELATDVEKLKASGVQYPLSIPMAATEGGVTPWYLLTLAMGGQLFDENNKPVFSDPN